MEPVVQIQEISDEEVISEEEEDTPKVQEDRGLFGRMKTFERKATYQEKPKLVIEPIGCEMMNAPRNKKVNLIKTAEFKIKRPSKDLIKNAIKDSHRDSQIKNNKNVNLFTDASSQNKGSDLGEIETQDEEETAYQKPSKKKNKPIGDIYKSFS